MKAPWSSNKGLKCFKKKRFVHFWLTCLKNIKENEVAIVPVSFVFGTALALFSWFCRLPRNSLSAAYYNGVSETLSEETLLFSFLFVFIIKVKYSEKATKFLKKSFSLF